MVVVVPTKELIKESNIRPTSTLMTAAEKRSKRKTTKSPTKYFELFIENFDFHRGNTWLVVEQGKNEDLELIWKRPRCTAFLHEIDGHTEAADIK